MNDQLPNNTTADILGDLKDRRTPLVENNWMAWTTFSHDIFTKLYRCDSPVASLFRNSLLAERIM